MSNFYDNLNIGGSLNIGTVLSGTSINNLGIDSSGNVVTGTTGSVSDIFVSGGTYSAGTATFTNTSGGTFDVTGFTSFDTYVIAGTYIDSTDTISLIRNDGNFVYITGITDTFTTGFTYSNNNFTISQNQGQPDLVTNISVMTGLTINGDLEVYGQSTMSGSGQNILTIIGSGDTNPLFTIQGSSGELFSVTDSLVGSLFSVNDISGLPILEVFDDDTVHMGSYQAPSLNTTVVLNSSTGLSTVYSVPMSAYTGAWFEYTVKNSGGARAGQIMSIFSGNTVNFTETTTTDIGSTSDITFSMSADSTNTLLQVSATTTGWEVKTIVRSI